MKLHDPYNSGMSALAYTAMIVIVLASYIGARWLMLHPEIFFCYACKGAL